MSLQNAESEKHLSFLHGGMLWYAYTSGCILCFIILELVYEET